MKHFSARFSLALIALIACMFHGRVSAQCTPAYGIGCGTGDDINSFTLTGASSSISDLSTGCSGTFYDDRTTVVPAVTLMQGGLYSGTINVTGLLGSPFSVDGMQIYIDFNNNSTFETSESVGGVNGISAAPSTTPYSITIPAAAALGSHRMRVVLCSDGDATYPGISPCAETVFPFPPIAFPYNIGETHDYTVNIIASGPTCAPVTGLGVSAITSGSATVSWTAVTGAIGYEWAVTTSPTPPASGTLTTLVSVVASPLTASTTYYAHVRTKCSATLFSSWVTTASFVTTAPPTTCDPVTGLGISAITSSSATASWTAVTGAIGYEWAVTTSATPPASGTLTTLTSVVASPLTASTTYYAHVRTKCSATLFSSWVTTASFVTTAPPTTCDPVTGLTMSAITSGSANLNWTAVTGAIGYEWAVTTSATPPASGTLTSLTSSIASPLTAATTYHAHVRTKCSPTLFSSWVSTTFVTPAVSTCPVITGLAASAITTTGATVSWTAVTSGSLGYQYVINNVVTDPIGSGTNTTATTTSPTGLTAATTYYAHVRDSCGVGDFSPWSTIPFTTLALPGGCNAVTGLTASAITASSANLAWTMASGALAAQWVVDNTAADPTVSGTVSTTSTAAVSGLTASTPYYAHVRDTCGATSLSAWVTIPFATLGSVSITEVSNGSAPFSVAAYPNPVGGILTIQVSGVIGSNAQLALTDITGKVIRTIPVSNYTTPLDMSVLPQGIYIIRYSDAGHVQTLKISKQ